MTKAIIGTVRVVLGQLITNHSVTYQTIQGSADYFYNEIYKCGISQSPLLTDLNAIVIRKRP